MIGQPKHLSLTALPKLTADEAELLSAYLDGELTGAERAEAEKLLAQRPEAKTLYRQLADLHEDLGLLRQNEHPIPSDLADRVLGNWQVERVRRARRGVIRWLASSAAAAAVVGGLVFWIHSETPSPSISTLGTPLAAASPRSKNEQEKIVVVGRLDLKTAERLALAEKPKGDLSAGTSPTLRQKLAVASPQPDTNRETSEATPLNLKEAGRLAMGEKPKRDLSLINVITPQEEAALTDKTAKSSPADQLEGQAAGAMVPVPLAKAQIKPTDGASVAQDTMTAQQQALTIARAATLRHLRLTVDARKPETLARVQDEIRRYQRGPKESPPAPMATLADASKLGKESKRLPTEPDNRPAAPASHASRSAGGLPQAAVPPVTRYTLHLTDQEAGELERKLSALNVVGKDEKDLERGHGPAGAAPPAPAPLPALGEAGGAEARQKSAAERQELAKHMPDEENRKCTDAASQPGPVSAIMVPAPAVPASQPVVEQKVTLIIDLIPIDQENAP